MSNFVRYRWWWLAGCIACLLWISIIQSNGRAAGAPAPPELGWAIAGAIILGLMFLIATLARRRDDDDSTGTGDRK